MIHQGSCHCGKVTYEVEGDIGKVYDCNCSHCRRKGFLLWFVPPDRFHLHQGEDSLGTYTFNTHAIRHRFCTTCGCAPFASGTGPDGKAMVSINLRCLPDVDLDALEIRKVDGRRF